MRAAEQRLDIATENLANAQTAGFTAQNAQVVATPEGLKTQALPSAAPPSFKQTGREWDIAVVGNGGLHVRNPATDRVETLQSGRFTRNPDGLIVDEHGRELLGAHGAIRVPKGARMQSDGTIATNSGTVARIVLPPQSQVQTGVLAVSNVDSIGEMVRMLDAQRSFETSAKVLTGIDETRQKNVTQVGVVR